MEVPILQGVFSVVQRLWREPDRLQRVQQQHWLRCPDNRLAIGNLHNFLKGESVTIKSFTFTSDNFSEGFR